MRKLKICDRCLYAEVTKCCRKCKECYCDECIILHHEEKHMRKHLRKINSLTKS